jgi:hypothetical protein
MSFLLVTLRCSPRVSHSCTSFNFGNKHFDVKFMIHYVKINIFRWTADYSYWKFEEVAQTEQASRKDNASLIVARLVTRTSHRLQKRYRNWRAFAWLRPLWPMARQVALLFVAPQSRSWQRANSKLSAGVWELLRLTSYFPFSWEWCVNMRDKL